MTVYLYNGNPHTRIDCLYIEAGPQCAKLSTSKSFVHFNTFGPTQNSHHFPEDIFKIIFLNENVWISIKISLKFVPQGPLNNTPAVVQIMAWGRPGDKPLSEPVMVSLLMHIWVTQPQWVQLSMWQTPTAV